MSYCLRLRVLDLSALSPAIREAEPSQRSAQEQECGRFRDGFQLAPDFPTLVVHDVDVEINLSVLDTQDQRHLSQRDHPTLKDDENQIIDYRLHEIKNDKRIDPKGHSQQEPRKRRKHNNNPNI